MDLWQFTPLHEAASKNRVEVCSLLLSHGADPTLVNCHGKSAVDMAPTPELRERLTCECFQTESTCWWLGRDAFLPGPLPRASEVGAKQRSSCSLCLALWSAQVLGMHCLWCCLVFWGLKLLRHCWIRDFGIFLCLKSSSVTQEPLYWGSVLHLETYRR